MITGVSLTYAVNNYRLWTWGCVAVTVGAVYVNTAECAFYSGTINDELRVQQLLYRHLGYI